MTYSSAQIAELEGRLARYLEAEAKVLRSQSTTLPDGRSVTRTNLAEIRKAIDALRRELDLATGTIRTRGRGRRGVIL